MEHSRGIKNEEAPSLSRGPAGGDSALRLPALYARSRPAVHGEWVPRRDQGRAACGAACGLQTTRGSRSARTGASQHGRQRRTGKRGDRGFNGDGFRAAETGPIHADARSAAPSLEVVELTWRRRPLRLRRAACALQSPSPRFHRAQNRSGKIPWCSCRVPASSTSARWRS